MPNPSPQPLYHPRCDAPVASNGYRWWYIDALSDCGSHGVTAIFFLGSVFSAYYAAARRRSDTPASDHCAVNVALYGKPRRWAMTERSCNQLQVNARGMQIGRSTLCFDNDCITMQVDERETPLPRRLRGQLRIYPELLNKERFHIDLANKHQWWPYCPRARIELEFSEPKLSWKGLAYLDSNQGCEPLEHGFKSWNWSRQMHPDQSVTIRYDRQFSSNLSQNLGVLIDQHGLTLTGLDNDEVQLPKTSIWRVPRSTRIKTDNGLKVIATLEDTPFYSRSVLGTNKSTQTFHESLSLERFSRRWVQGLLPFRNPRSDRY